MKASFISHRRPVQLDTPRCRCQILHPSGRNSRGRPTSRKSANLVNILHKKVPEGAELPWGDKPTARDVVVLSVRVPPLPVTRVNRKGVKCCISA